MEVSLSTTYTPANTLLCIPIAPINSITPWYNYMMFVYDTNHDNGSGQTEYNKFDLDLLLLMFW